MEDGGEAGDEDGANGAGAEYAVQGSRAFGVIMLEQKLGGDSGHAKGNRGITP